MQKRSCTSAERRYRRAPLRGAIHIIITKLLYLLSLIEGGAVFEIYRYANFRVIKQVVRLIKKWYTYHFLWYFDHFDIWEQN